eukprot:scaffold6984_cov134-Alexandrium_tamarense.AAC.1
MMSSVRNNLALHATPPPKTTVTSSSSRSRLRHEASTTPLGRRVRTYDRHDEITCEKCERRECGGWWCQFVTLSSTFDVDGIFYKGFVLIPNITARSQRQ